MIQPELTEKILHFVAIERMSQDAKWGEQNHDPRFWMSVLGEEFGESCRAANHLMWGDFDSAVNRFHYALELLQTAAVAVAAVEALTRLLSDADLGVFYDSLDDWEVAARRRWQEFITPQKVEAE